MDWRLFDPRDDGFYILCEGFTPGRSFSQRVQLLSRSSSVSQFHMHNSSLWAFQNRLGWFCVIFWDIALDVLNHIIAKS